MPKTPSKTHSRPKCKNCDRPFTPNKPWQKFCQNRVPGNPDACRQEFHQFGGAYRKVMAHVEQQLPAMVWTAIDTQRKELAAQFEIFRRDIQAERALVVEAVARYEAARRKELEPPAQRRTA